MPKKISARTQARNDRIEYLENKVKVFEELFKQREARPILLPNGMTDDEKEWIISKTLTKLTPSLYNFAVKLLEVERTALTKDLSDSPTAVEQKIITLDQ